MKFRLFCCFTLLWCIIPTLVHASVDFVRIPLVRDSEQAPVIDGVMQGGEWKYAVAMTGIISNEGSLAQRQATVYYISDGQWLYVGAYAPAVPEGTVPQVQQGPKYDGKNYMDFSANDRVEVKFAPPKRMEVGDYIFVADAAGHTFLEVNKDFGQPVRGAWEYKSSYDAKGWTVEMRAPMSQFGQKVAANGDPWRLNFTFARLFPLKYEGLSSGGPHGLCDAMLTADAPAVQIERLGNLPKGQLNLAVSVREYEGLVATPKEGAYDERNVESGGLALKGTGKAARVAWELLEADGKVVATGTKVLELRPAAKATASFTQTFTPGVKNTLKLTVEMADSAKAFDGPADPVKITPLYRASLPFKPFDESEAKAWLDRLTRGTVLDSWRFNPAFFPYWEKAKVQVIFFQGKVREQARKVRVTITSDKGFTAVREVPVADGVMVANTPDTLLEIPIPGLPKGIYHARGEVLDAAGKVVSTQERDYTRTLYPWEHNSLGLSRGVIKPWTPMHVYGNMISCWGRTLTLSTAGLATQVVSQEQPLLAAPVALELRGNDGNLLPLIPTGPFTYAEEAVDLVRWQGQGTLGPDITVRVTGQAEYDGFTWYDVTLTPAKPVQVAGGRLVIPLAERQAQLMHLQPQWARNNFSGAVPSGTGVVYQSLGTNGKTGGFTPHAWIGNPTRGLSWFADSAEGWSLAADRSALEVVRTNGQVQLVLHIFSKAVTLDTPRTIRFGLMATPLKPTLPIRDITTKAVNWIGKGGYPGGAIQAFMYAHYPLNFDYTLIDNNMPGCRLYFNKHEMGAALPERAVFDNEWGGMEPAGDYPGDSNRFSPGLQSRTINRVITDSRTDMMVYYIAELAKKSKMAATYWDLTGIGDSGPMLENGAYVNPETGAVQRIADIRKARQLFKRVATMWQEVRGEPDYMEIHSTNHMSIPCYSFAYSWLNFEWLWPNAKATRPDGRWMDFIDLRPLDLFATEGSPSQYGVWINSINGGARPEEPAEFRRVARSCEALAMLHNHNNHGGMGGSGLTPPPTIGRRDDVQFVGYWDENRRVKTDQPKVMASYWYTADKLELVAVNLDLEPRTVTVTIPLAPLGWKDAGKAVETTTEQELENKRNWWLRNNKTELAKSADTVLAAVRAARLAPVVRVVDGTVQLTFELPSHDYRTFTVEALAKLNAPVAAPATAPVDIWAPWRKASKLETEVYRVSDAPAMMFSPLTPAANITFPTQDVQLPFSIDLSNAVLTGTEGVVVTFRFRTEKVPLAKLPASLELAHFTLKGPTDERPFVLHAYSGNSGLFLNGLASAKACPRQQVLLARGAATPHTAMRWDTQWHTVRIAWCRGQLAASWDGLPFLHLADPGVAYRTLTLRMVKPTIEFGTLELSPFEVRPAHFTPSVAGAFSAEAESETHP
jgi:hypothetical protein